MLKRSKYESQDSSNFLASLLTLYVTSLKVAYWILVLAPIMASLLYVHFEVIYSFSKQSDCPLCCSTLFMALQADITLETNLLSSFPRSFVY